MCKRTVFCGYAVTAVMPSVCWRSVDIWSWRLSGVGDDDSIDTEFLVGICSGYSLANTLGDELIFRLKNSPKYIWGGNADSKADSFSVGQSRPTVRSHS